MTTVKHDLQTLCRELLLEIGEDPTREGLTKTPQRFAQAFSELTVGYEQKSEDLVNGALFSTSVSEMVVVRNIEFYSLCEHHLLPFFGKVNVAYIPREKVIGLSKIPRIVNMFARRLQIQENLTEQISSELERLLNPAGVACTIEGMHLCMMMRGIQAQNCTLVTSSMRGVFLQNSSTRQEFFSLLKLHE